MTVSTPPEGPEIEANRDLEQRVADLEALIEEARRRARRRRTRRGAAALLLVAAGAAAFFGFGGHGGGGAGTAALGHVRASSGSVAASSAAVVLPKCSEASTPKVDTGAAFGHTIWVALPAIATTHGHSTFTQFCGPATVNVRAHGQAFRIRSGYCNASRLAYFQYELHAGLEGHVPAAPAKFFEFAVHKPSAVRGAGTFPASAAMQLAGHTFATAKPPGGITNWTAALLPRTITRGTVTIAKSMHAGTFAFHLRDSTQITGSWTCG